MDKTAVFRAYVKTIKTRNRAFGSSSSSNQQQNGAAAAADSPLLPGGKRKPLGRDDFSRRAKDVINDLAKLTDFLDRHRRDYVQSSSSSSFDRLTDADRDKIDAGAQHIVKTCGQQLTALGQTLAAGERGNGGGRRQIDDHRRQMVRHVEWRLKSVAKTFAEMRAERAQRCADYENVSKLSNLTQHGAGRPPPAMAAVEYESAYAAARPDDDDELSPEELQMFEAENIEMYNELNQLSNEVRNIESKAVRIAELQELFTEKILEQDQDLERIDSVTVNTTENILDANAEIRMAIQTNAGLRVYILFFILVLSFSLLFLDWYND